MPLSAARIATSHPWRATRFSLLPVLLLVVLPVIMATAAESQAMAQTGYIEPLTVRIISYNIHHGTGNDHCDHAAAHGGDCGLDLERIARVLMAHQPDIVALQEVDRFWKRSAGVDQATEFARLLDMKPCYGANLKLPGDIPGSPEREYGTLILSRHPITQCRNHLLPKASEGAEQRGALRADIQLQGRLLTVWNTHLHIRQEDRLVQTRALVDLLNEDGSADSTAAPAVLLGDLNARPGTRELVPLLEILDDAWAMAGYGAGLTSPASANQPPRNRIDYILTSRDIDVPSIVVDRSAEATMASDHYPVAAVLRLP